ncbi:MAG: carboxylating nicotinate-nucleotide diphosphorylase, partial [Planctomycetota bacterium]
MEFPQRAFQTLLRLGLEEDIPKSDITTEAIVPHDFLVRAVIIAKQQGILSGLPGLPLSFGNKCRVDFQKKDSDILQPGETIAVIRGPAAQILTLERISLNFIQRSSGIATITQRFVERAGKRIKILGTRKTPPGYRELDRYAIVMGGGNAHRAHLSDQILIKENHFYIAKLLGKSFEAVLQDIASKNAVFQTEVETLEQACIAAKYTDHILLDNMAPPQLEICIKEIRKINPEAQIEASGGITLNNIPELALLDLDRIS